MRSFGLRFGIDFPFRKQRVEFFGRRDGQVVSLQYPLFCSIPGQFHPVRHVLGEGGFLLSFGGQKNIGGRQDYYLRIFRKARSLQIMQGGVGTIRAVITNQNFHLLFVHIGRWILRCCWKCGEPSGFFIASSLLSEQIFIMTRVIPR